jgi:hypothetical protein
VIQVNLKRLDTNASILHATNMALIRHHSHAENTSPRENHVHFLMEMRMEMRPQDLYQHVLDGNNDVIIVTHLVGTLMKDSKVTTLFTQFQQLSFHK